MNRSARASDDAAVLRRVAAAIAGAAAACFAYGFELARATLHDGAPRFTPGGVPYFGRLIICAIAAAVIAVAVARLARGRERAATRWSTRCLWAAVAFTTAVSVVWP